MVVIQDVVACCRCGVKFGLINLREDGRMGGREDGKTGMRFGRSAKMPDMQEQNRSSNHRQLFPRGQELTKVKYWHCYST